MMYEFCDYVDTLNEKELRKLRSTLVMEQRECAQFGHNEDWHSTQRDIATVDAALNTIEERHDETNGQHVYPEKRIR